MLSQKEILDFLTKNNNTIKKKFAVVNIALFGSYAKNTAIEESDIDLLVEFSEHTYDNLAGLYIYLEENLGKKIDIVSKHRYMRKSFLEIVEKEALYI